MDSKKYTDKVIDLHGFSLECYPTYTDYGYIFFDDGIDLFCLDPSFIEDKYVTYNFIFSILGRFYEHFIGNLCIKEEDFWYAWDTVIYKLNRKMMEKLYTHFIPRRDYYMGYYEPNFILPNSHEFIKNLIINFGGGTNRFINGSGLCITYVQYDSIKNTNTFKELKLPIPNFR